MSDDLLTRIAEKKGIKRAGLQVTLSKIKKRLDLKSTEQAACYYIKVHGVDINVSDTIDDRTKQAVRDTLATKTKAGAIGIESPTSRGSPIKGTSPSQSFGELHADPFVNSVVFSAARKNADLYPVIYIFENSVRVVVSKVMEKHFKENWWETQVSNAIRSKVNGRRSSEQKSPWHSQRGAAPIYYADIDDVLTIMRSKPNEFTAAFGNIHRVEVWITEIERTRNTLAHNNPVSNRDSNRLKVYARDWSDFAKTLDGKL